MKNKFFNWLEGFRKKEYVVPLATETDLYKINLDIMGSIFESMSRNMVNFTCESASFSILDFKASKVIGNLMIRYNLLKKKDSISHLKVSRCGLDISSKREIFVSASVFCMGLDGEIWRFDFKASTIYTSLRNDIEMQIVDLLIDYLNGFIKSLQLSQMCTHEVKIQNTLSYESVHSEIYNGWVKSFCNELEYQNVAPLYDASDMNNEATILLHSIDEEDMQKEVEGESMIIDVIRRKNNSMNLREGVSLSDVFDRETNQSLTIEDIITEPEYEHTVNIPMKKEDINET